MDRAEAPPPAEPTHSWDFCQTLLQAAVLAAVPVRSVDQAVPLAGTGVHRVVLLAATEEALDKHTRGIAVNDEDMRDGTGRLQVPLHPSLSSRLYNSSVSIPHNTHSAGSTDTPPPPQTLSSTG
ncbi:hypothetical protein EYF80_011637 [Liparis tanakae]|uniref:Uncharacterized protein n=1 Tax=Liparis tanakae TaxID=230148 RepID=A0A4Z2ILQ9_9TELE|nr:hypothetical protein EYF80_011637 [Liparis tanakae]